jgi:hypothetical protein
MKFSGSTNLITKTEIERVFEDFPAAMREKKGENV